MADWWSWLMDEGRTLAFSLIAGAAGGFVRTVALGQKGRAAFVANMATGVIFAAYIGPHMRPIIVPLLGEDAATTSLSGFVAGLCGMTIAGIVLDFAQRYFSMRRRLHDERDKKSN